MAYAKHADASVRQVEPTRGAVLASLTTSVVLLSILEYYAYSISPGQAAAHGGHAKLSGGHAVLLHIHVPYTHTTSHMDGDTHAEVLRVLILVVGDMRSTQRQGTVPSTITAPSIVRAKKVPI